MIVYSNCNMCGKQDRFLGGRVRFSSNNEAPNTFFKPWVRAVWVRAGVLGEGQAAEAPAVSRRAGSQTFSLQLLQPPLHEQLGPRLPPQDPQREEVLPVPPMPRRWGRKRVLWGRCERRVRSCEAASVCREGVVNVVWGRLAKGPFVLWKLSFWITFCICSVLSTVYFLNVAWGCSAKEPFVLVKVVILDYFLPLFLFIFWILCEVAWQKSFFILWTV